MSFYTLPPVVAAPAIIPPSAPVDPWLQDWLKRNDPSRATKKWTRTMMAAQLDRLGTLLREAEQVSVGSKSTIATKETESLEDEIEKIMADLSDESALRMFASKELKRQRKERWVSRKKERKEEAAEREADEHALMGRLVDEWRAVCAETEAKEKARRDEGKEAATRRARTSSEQTQQREALIVAHLELLAALRSSPRAPLTVTNLPRHADEQLRGFYDELLRENHDDKKEEENVEKNTVSTLPATSAVPYWESFYGAAEQSVEALVEVRRRWDACLTREAQEGSCVPPYWLTPSTRPPSAWRAHLIYKAK